MQPPYRDECPGVSVSIGTTVDARSDIAGAISTLSAKAAGNGHTGQHQPQNPHAAIPSPGVSTTLYSSATSPLSKLSPNMATDARRPVNLWTTKPPPRSSESAQLLVVDRRRLPYPPMNASVTFLMTGYRTFSWNT
jgi:hypothetical protein